MESKVCTKCGEDKPLSEYHRKSAAKDGHETRCKVCIVARQRIYNKANRTKINESMRAHYVANRSEKLSYQKRYSASIREADPERFVEYNRTYHAEKWANDSGYRDRAYARKVKYSRAKASAVQEPYTRESIFERDGWTCRICNESIDRGLRHPNPRSGSIDHVVPLSLGGDDTPGNVQSAHLGCNSGKRNRIPENGVQPGLF